MMFCPKEEEWQVYLDGELAADAREAAQSHLNACPRCAAVLKEIEQSLTLVAAAFTRELPGAAPTARLRARIELALSEQTTPKTSWVQAFWRFGLIAASAAVIAGLIGWSVWRSLTTPSPELDSRAQSGPATPSVTPGPQIPPRQVVEPTVVSAKSPRPRRPVRRRAVVGDDEEAEVVTQFFPLREGEDLTALENLRLVRMELPGSALAEVGLPISPGIINQTVTADVMLGDDGLARAIRFVR